jgi:hypothetical protein
MTFLTDQGMITVRRKKRGEQNEPKEKHEKYNNVRRTYIIEIILPSRQ